MFLVGSSCHCYINTVFFQLLRKSGAFYLKLITIIVKEFSDFRMPVKVSSEVWIRTGLITGAPHIAVGGLLVQPSGIPPRTVSTTESARNWYNRSTLTLSPF